jgi:hypothetical protein
MTQVPQYVLKRGSSRMGDSCYDSIGPNHDDSAARYIYADILSGRNVWLVTEAIEAIGGVIWVHRGH